MVEQGRYHGGLIFSGDDEGNLTKFAESVASTLEDYGHPVDRQIVMNASRAGVTASHYHVSLSIETVVPTSDQMQRTMRLDALGRLNQPHSGRQAAPKRLSIDMCAADPKRDDRELSELVLVVMLYRLVELCPVISVEWLSPDTVLTMEQFLTPFNNLSSGVAHNGHYMPGATITKEPSSTPETYASPVKPLDGTEEESLVQIFRTAPKRSDLDAVRALDGQPNDINRLASWGMTGMMVFLSAPVAASMAAVNLIKGEDFRLNTQVLSLSGLLVSLQSTGALASVVSNLPM